MSFSMTPTMTLAVAERMVRAAEENLNKARRAVRDNPNSIELRLTLRMATKYLENELETFNKARQQAEQL